MADNTLQTFPKNEIEALAMLYVQNQDMSDLTPEELFDKYQDAYEKIKTHRSEKRKAQRSQTGWML